MTIQFFKHGNLIHARINPGKGKGNIRFSTKIKAKNLEWDEDRKRFKGKSGLVLQNNSKLNRVSALFPDVIVRRLNEKFLAVTLENAKQEILIELGLVMETVTEGLTLLQAFKEYIEAKEAEGRAPGTIHYIKTCYKKYKAFVGDDIGLDLFRLDMYDAKERKVRLRMQQTVQRHINEYLLWMVEDGMKVSSQGEYLNKLKSAMKQAEENHGIMLYTSFKTPKENLTPITLPLSVARRIIQKDQVDMNCPEEALAWAMAFLALLSTLRVSDILSLTKRHIIERSGIKHISISNEKTFSRTGARTICAIHPLLEEDTMVAVSIIENRQWKDRTIEWKIPPVLKQMLSRYDEMKQEVPYPRLSPSGKIDVKYPKLYELITMHKLRATSITSYLDSGLTEKSTKGMSGHSASSKAFKSYVDIDTDKHLNNVVKAQADIFL